VIAIHIYEVKKIYSPILERSAYGKQVFFAEKLLFVQHIISEFILDNLYRKYLSCLWVAFFMQKIKLILQNSYYK